ncbi:MAG: cytochrome c [Chloroflexi bacterium]|nr:cytochrome c [Chloroflexota bacterium]
MSRVMLIPLVAGAWVVGVGLSLVAIVVLSPYTHGNLAPHLDLAFTRTQQTTVGPPIPYRGPGPAGPPPAAANAVARGQELMVAGGCATCHGLDGRGGPVGQPIVGFSASELRTKTTKGPGGMPAFSQEGLSDDDLTAIAAYLTSLKK